MTRVLYSPGYGAGLSTWNEEIPANDPKLLELYDKGATTNEVEKVYPNGYWGGWENVECYEVPEGCWFKVDEYDGNESVSVISSLEDSGYTKS